MKPRHLNFFLILGLALFCPTAKSQQNETWAQQIARLEADFRRAPRAYTLSYLADAREGAGQLDKAESSWNYLARRFGDEESDFFGENSESNRLTYAQLALWTKARIARKRNLARLGAATPDEKGRALRAAMRLMDSPPVSHLDAQRNIDLDGDGIEEIMIYGRSGEFPGGKRNSVAIWKWNGQKFTPIWSKRSNLPSDVKYADHDTDWNKLGDAFTEIVLFYAGNDKRVQTLSFNGRSFISTIVR